MLLIRENQRSGRLKRLNKQEDDSDDEKPMRAKKSKREEDLTSPLEKKFKAETIQDMDKKLK